MFLHLGGDIVVGIEDIIAILDIESTSYSKHSKSFLNKCEDDGIIFKITDDEPRSFVITENLKNKIKKGKTSRQIVVYYSPISAPTLQKRANLTNI